MGIDTIQFMKQSMTSGLPQSWQCQFCGCENLMEDKKCCNCGSPRHISKELKESTQEKSGEKNEQTGTIDMQVFQQIDSVSAQMFQETEALMEQMLKRSETVRSQASKEPGAAGQQKQTPKQQAVQRPDGPTKQEIRNQTKKDIVQFANCIFWFFTILCGMSVLSGIYNKLLVFSVFMLPASVLFSPLRKKLLPKVHPALRILLAFGCFFIAMLFG